MASSSVPVQSDRQFVTALARGISVLRCFTADTPELSVSEIARLTSLPQPTVWRLCHTLEQLGYLVTMPDSQTLRAGIPLLSLGQAAVAAQSIAQLAMPHMKRIASEYEGAVSLGVRDGDDMVYLQRQHGSSIILGNLRVGSRVPIAVSATGWAYVAGLQPAEQEKLIAHLCKSAGPLGTDLESRLHKALAQYRTDGYVFNLGLLHPQVHSVGVPVISPDGETILALSSGGIAQVFSTDVLARIGGELVRLADLLAPALAVSELQGI